MRWSKLALDVGVQMLTDALGGAKIIEVLLGAAFVVIDAAQLVADDEGARHRVVASARNVERAMEAIPVLDAAGKPTGKYVGRVSRLVW